MKDDTQTRAEFAEKLATFVKPLNRGEQAMFRAILERGGLTSGEVARLRPGKLGDVSVASRATRLDAAFFNKLLDW